jgi:hypothetical protein
MEDGEAVMANPVPAKTRLGGTFLQRQSAIQRYRTILRLRRAVGLRGVLFGPAIGCGVTAGAHQEVRQHRATARIEDIDLSYSPECVLPRMTSEVRVSSTPGRPSGNVTGAITPSDIARASTSNAGILCHFCFLPKFNSG